MAIQRESNIVKNMREVMKSELEPCFWIEAVLRTLKVFSFGFIAHQNILIFENEVWIKYIMEYIGDMHL